MDSFYPDLNGTHLKLPSYACLTYNEWLYFKNRRGD